MGGHLHAPTGLPQTKKSGTPCTGVGFETGQEGSEKLASTGVQTLDRPARSESLHRVHYPVPH
jgi:hypothetical protein